MTEVVVIGEEDYDTKHVVEAKASSVKAVLNADRDDDEVEPITRKLSTSLYILI